MAINLEKGEKYIALVEKCNSSTRQEFGKGSNFSLGENNHGILLFYGGGGMAFVLLGFQVFYKHFLKNCNLLVSISNDLILLH